MPVGARSIAREPLELAAVFELTQGPGPGVERLSGVDACHAIYSHTYRGALVEVIGTSEDFWSRAMQLVRGVPVFRLQRSWDLNAMDEELAGLITRTVAEAEQA